MKTPVLLLILCFKILCFCGLASGRDEAALAEFEERVKNVATPKEASELTAEIMTAKDYDRMEICLRYPRTANFVAIHYKTEPASEFKDRLTSDLIARPWEPEVPAEGGDGGEAGRTRSAVSPETFKPYVDYMRERLGEDVSSMGSPDDLMKADSTPEDRALVARRFKNALVKTGVVEGKNTKRASKNWVPGKEKDAAGADAGGGNTNLYIIGAAVLVLAAGGYFVFKKKAA